LKIRNQKIKEKTMQNDSLKDKITPLLIPVALCLFAFFEAQAQVSLGGGESMVKDMKFIGNFASTAEDIIFIASKVIGAGLCLVGVKNIGSRNWEHAIPGLLGGSGLFFLPQIVEGLKAMGVSK
jgi:hypothetical protein